MATQKHEYKVGDKLRLKHKCDNAMDANLNVGDVFEVFELKHYGDNGGMRIRYAYHAFYKVKSGDNIPQDAVELVVVDWLDNLVVEAKGIV